MAVASAADGIHLYGASLSPLCPGPASLTECWPSSEVRRTAKSSCSNAVASSGDATSMTGVLLTLPTLSWIATVVIVPALPLAVSLPVIGQDPVASKR